MEPETVAELQARQVKLEQQVTELKAKAQDDLVKEKIKAARTEIAEINAKIENAQLRDQLKQSSEIEARRKEQDADAAVQAMINDGAIAIRDTETQEFWKNKFIGDPTLIRASAGNKAVLAKSQVGYQLTSAVATPGRIAPNAAQVDASARQMTGGGGLRIEGGFSVPGAMRKYYELVSANAKMRVGNQLDSGDRFEIYKKKGEMARQAGALFKSDLEPELKKWEYLSARDLGGCIGLQAADYSDPNNNVGTLSGTLVLQRVLSQFAFKFPQLLALLTDFGDTPGLYKQTEMTRIVLQPAVQVYNAGLDAGGRTIGWSVASPAKTTDVPITLTDYISVPINFGNNVLASTMRRLFDEQAVLAIKAIAGYFTGMLTDLATSANYNSYAAGIGGIPNVGATYIQGQQNFSMTDLDNISAAFSLNKVPEEDRSILLTPAYYARLRSDQRLVLQYSTNRDSAYLSEFMLPKLCGFAPINAPYMPTGTPVAAPTTNLVTGFAFQKAAAILKARLPQDFSQVLGVMIPGSITTVTDPDTGISIMLVQYVNLQTNDAEWRPEVMLGAAKGDPRAGLVLTSA